jgi:hypothetical protein
MDAKACCEMRLKTFGGPFEHHLKDIGDSLGKAPKTIGDFIITLTD